MKPKTEWGDKERTATHILNASSNLLGLCFFIVAYFKGSGYAAQTSMDEVTGIAAAVFALSTFFSFLSIRTKPGKLSTWRELLAEALFFVGIIIILLIIFVSFVWYF